MSETKHNPEPWRWGRSGLFDSAGEHVSIAKDDAHGRGPLNRRRVLAAVNAVAGIPTEALESGALGEALEAARSLFPFGPDHNALLMLRENADRLHAALRRLGRLSP